VHSTSSILLFPPGEEGLVRPYLRALSEHILFWEGARLGAPGVGG
jgi:hypothetical protein